MNRLGDGPKQRTEAGPVSSRSTGLPETANTTTASQHASTQGLAQGRLRPRSMYQTSSGRPEQLAEGKIPARSMRAPDAVSSSTSSVPQLAGLNRSQSLRKPDISTQSAQIPNARAHTRTQSINTITSTRKDSAEARTYSERPKSLFVEPSRTTKPASNTPADIVPNGIRTSVRLAALKRSASTRTKPEIIESSEAIGEAIGPDEPTTTSSRRREPLKEEPKKHGRPAFSTLQQHFTPRKIGKAPTSTFLHPPAPDVGPGELPSEITSLQSELLQLHLIHALEAQTSRQWELSAKRNLRGKFDEVASLYQVMRENERQGQEQKNIQALCEWNSGNSSFALVEHIQILSGPLHELPSLVDTGGRFKRLVDEFERWTAKVGEVWTARVADAKGQGGHSEHVEGLRDVWKAENAALTRKLITFSRDLDRLTQPASGSSIACIVATYKALLGGILDELQIMQTIEAGVVAREQEWIEARLKAIARGVGAHLVEMQEGNEAWRT